jgi:hypothetical protein
VVDFSAFQSFHLASNQRPPSGDGEEPISLGRLTQPGNRAERLESPEKQDIVPHVIRACLAQKYYAETPVRRDSKQVHSQLAVRIIIVHVPSIPVHEAPSSEPSTASLFR